MKRNLSKVVKVKLLIISVIIFLLFLSLSNVLINGLVGVSLLERINPFDMLLGLVFAVAWIGLPYYLSILLVLMVCILIIYVIYRMLKAILNKFDKIRS